jgi:hypothetical protein
VVVVSYFFGWSLITRTKVRRERWPGNYEMECVPLVQPGDYVESEQPVIRLEKPAGTIGLLPEVPGLSLPTNTKQYLPGTINSRKQRRSEMIAAGLRGTVVRVMPRGSVVIESKVAAVAGAIGAGQQTSGPLTLWQASDTASGQSYIPRGAILVVPGPLNLAMLHQALNSKVAGVVASSISSRDFESFLHVDLIDLLNCPNPDLVLPHLPSLTLLLTEGLGTLAMPVHTINLLSKYQGTIGLLSGVTSIRANRYPELMISLPDEEIQPDWHEIRPDLELLHGALVRVCSGNYEGALGEISYLFSHQQIFPSGVRAHAARLRLEDGSQLVVPLSVLERIG